MLCSNSVTEVAPRVGAWIETLNQYAHDLTRKSHPVWVRGLKRFNLLVKSFVELSHPVWVRGLKPQFANLGEQEILSHPVWVRGLKH